jgi:hypothetical protein
MRLRCCARSDTRFPVIFAGDAYVGEGTVRNLSVPGCAIDSRRGVRPGSYLEMKVLLPDASPPLSVGLAKVRWTRGHRFGVEFIRISGEDQIRVGRLIRKRPALSLVP